jgi:peptide/nickel transport system substrate-binding protein
MRQVRVVRWLGVAALAVVPVLIAVSVAVPAAIAGSRALQVGGVGPVSGGTLRIVAGPGPDHLDPVPAYYNADYILEHAYARQLLSYPAEPDRAIGAPGWQADITPVPDAATAVPTIANGGVSNGGKTYSFHIRPWVTWQTGAAVTSADFLREFKAYCNPVAPVGVISYFEATIVGMTSYCDAEAGYFRAHAVTPANVANFQDTHPIAGIATPNTSEIQFTLLRPASDFLYLMALPFTSARPASYDRYLPDSLQLRKHIISDGPYEITSYRPGRSLVLARNPAWRQASDQIRHQYASKITVTLGVFSAHAQIAGLRAGRWDLMLDTPVPPSAVSRLKSSPDFHTWPSPDLYPYLVFNLRSPNQRHAASRLGVRRAIEYGVDKVAVQRVFGGPALAPIVTSALPPGNLGAAHVNPYPTPGERGSPSRCRADRARAGYRSGLKLRFMYPNEPVNTSLFQSVKVSLSRCGIILVARPEPISSYYADLGNTQANNRPGTWDLAVPGWAPDWFGNTGRSVLAPLFSGSCVVGTFNYGCYHSARVNDLIAAAETAPTQAAAAMFWHSANIAIMRDAPIVPLLSQQAPIFASNRVREKGLRGGVVFLPNISGPDVTNIRIVNR